MQPDASIAPGLAPLSQTLVGPVQHVLNICVIPGNTELQSPGCGACAVAARFRAADMHCRISWTCCGEVLFAFESVPTEQMSSVDETGVAAAVVFTTRPQLGRPVPRTLCVMCGCVPQKPGVRVKQFLGGTLQTLSSLADTWRVLPTALQVTDASSHELLASPRSWAVTVAIPPAASGDGMVPGGSSATDVGLPVGGQVASRVKMLSCTTQFSMSVPPVLFTVIVTLFLAFGVPEQTLTLDTLFTSRFSVHVPGDRTACRG